MLDEKSSKTIKFLCAFAYKLKAFFVTLINLVYFLEIYCRGSGKFVIKP